MTVMMTPEEMQVERDQIEIVFALGGGELETDLLEYEDRNGSRGGFRYHYDGMPSWIEDEHPNRFEQGFLTVVRDCLWEMPPAEIMVKDRWYRRIAYFRSSGEAACPHREGPDPLEGAPCPLCGRAVGEPHAHVYLGEGWCEVLYKEI